MARIPNPKSPNFDTEGPLNGASANGSTVGTVGRDGGQRHVEDLSSHDVITAEVRYDPIEELVNLNDIEDDSTDGDAIALSDDEALSHARATSK